MLGFGVNEGWRMMVREHGMREWRMCVQCVIEWQVYGMLAID